MYKFLNIDENKCGIKINGNTYEVFNNFFELWLKKVKAPGKFQGNGRSAHVLFLIFYLCHLSYFSEIQSHKFS